MRLENIFADSFFDGFGLNGLFFTARRADAPTEAFAPESNVDHIMHVSAGGNNWTEAVRSEGIAVEASRVVEETLVGKVAVDVERVSTTR